MYVPGNNGKKQSGSLVRDSHDYVYMQGRNIGGFSLEVAKVHVGCQTVNFFLQLYGST